MLAGHIDRPAGAPRAWALFAHCFTCGKDLRSAQAIAGSLASAGIAVLRFDFTGLGESGGDFSDTNFSSNGRDLIAAADWLRENESAPALLVGHSLGGAAALAIADHIPELKAIATIGAPADPGHITHLLADQLDAINERGEARVKLAGRLFTVQKQFLEDVSASRLEPQIRSLRKALLVLHARTDEVVGIGNAGTIFGWAKHPKSFLALEGANHLLSRPADAHYAGRAIAAWSDHYLDPPVGPPDPEVRVAEAGDSRFQQRITSGRHHLTADEGVAMGGLDKGPSPYQLLLASLGACTAMTVRLHAERNGFPLQRVAVDLTHYRDQESEDSASDEWRSEGAERIEKVVHLEGDLSGSQRERLLDIAARCPVHRTLTRSISIVTRAHRPSDEVATPH